ncbi:hypothetical protein ACP3V5_13530 [Vibrio maritimus]
MKEEYKILSNKNIDRFPLKQSPRRIAQSEPDLLLELTFSPKLFLIDDISKKIEAVLKKGVEWLDARVDCSPSMPSEEQFLIYDNYRMPYIFQTYRLTDVEKIHGKLNWIDIENTEFDFTRLEGVPLEERLIFKLEEDYGIVFIHNSIIELLEQHVKDIWIRIV